MLEDTGKKYKNGTIIWRCRCRCGNVSEVISSSLRSYHTTSCGKCPVNTYYEKDDYTVGVTSKGEKFYFDKEDFERVNQHSWGTYNGYVVATVDGHTIKLHRLILNPGKDKLVDHVNHNVLDNRRSNLRVCTCSQNNANSRIPKTNTSGYKGVCWHKGAGKWMARVTVKRKGIYLGLFDSKEEAALTYNKAASFYFGEFACLNVIESNPLSLKQKEVSRC